MLPTIIIAAAAAALFIGFLIRQRRKSTIVRVSTAQAVEPATAEDRAQPIDEAVRQLEAVKESVASAVDRAWHGGSMAGGPDTGTVLIVDDQPMLRMMLKEVLETAGVNVCEAASGQEALELAASSVLDLMLLDMRMPGMDGVELLRRLRSWDGNPNASVPCAFISALGDPDKEREAGELGVTKFIAKPFDIFAVRDYVLNELKIRKQQLKAE